MSACGAIKISTANSPTEVVRVAKRTHKLTGARAPPAKKKKPRKAAAAPSKKTAAAPSKKAAAAQLVSDIAAVELPAQVPVYDNCDEVRRKIDRFLLQSGATKARFLRAIGCNADGLIRFRKMEGKGAGAANKVYHSAYRFFELQRLLEKGPKTAKRLASEARWGGGPDGGGYPLENSWSGAFVQEDDGGGGYLGPPPEVLARLAPIQALMDDIDFCQDRANAGLSPDPDVHERCAMLYHGHSGLTPLVGGSDCAAAAHAQMSDLVNSAMHSVGHVGGAAVGGDGGSSSSDDEGEAAFGCGGGGGRVCSECFAPTAKQCVCY